MLNNLNNSESSEDIISLWHRLLQILEVSRNHERISLSSGDSATPNPINDSILPSLLLLQFVSLFEDEATHRIQEKGWKLKKNDLYNIIQLLADNNDISNKSKLHKIRKARNDVAHHFKFIDWSYLVHSVDIIEKELQKWELIGNRPDYQFFVERSVAKEAENEDFKFAPDYEVGVKLDDKKLWMYKWTTMFG